MEDFVWPSGVRDTTEFPKVEVSIDVTVREHLATFCKFDGLGWNDHDAQRKACGQSILDQRLRSYRKMYERLGLIYNDHGKLRLSTLAKSITSLKSDLEIKKESELNSIRAVAADILSRYQLKNPIDGTTLDPNCDVLPNICIWKAMRQLDNKIHHEEMNRILLHVACMGELDDAISRIKANRIPTGYGDKTAAELDTLLGKQAIETDQESARIAPWFSLAGWGGLLIQKQVDSQGFRNLCDEALPVIDAILADPPVYHDIDDIDEWYQYFIGTHTIEKSVDPLAATTTPVVGGENILLYGVPGCGKSDYINKHYATSPDFVERVVFHPDYCHSDFIGQILPRVVDDKLKYVFVAGPFTAITKKAIHDPSHPYYLIIEELNRGNAPAIFGEIFQLLDRDDDGKSKYAITNFDMGEEIYDDCEKKIELPPNLWILATMNTADQNVFTLDTAFQRRWQMKHIKNDVMAATHATHLIEKSKIDWGTFASIINEEIISANAGVSSSEDKRLGAYFAVESDLAKKRFPEKVLKYLWDDAFKMERDFAFATNMHTLDDILDAYEAATGDPLKVIFTESVYEKMKEKMEKKEAVSDSEDVISKESEDSIETKDNTEIEIPEE